MGGDEIPARRRAGSRVAPAAVALAALAGVVLYPALEARQLVLPLTALGAAAVVLLAVGLAGVPVLVGLAIALAGAEYTAWLARDARALDGASPLVAAGLVLAAELAYRSLDARGPVPPADGENLRRVLTAVAVAVAGGATGILVLGAGDAAPGGGHLLEAAAVVAAVGAVALVAVLSAPIRPVDSRSDRGSPR